MVEVADPAGLMSASPLAWLARMSQAAAHQATPLPGEVRVRLIDDAAMAAAHLKYSSIPGTTDVLTFDMADGQSAQGEPLDVDILVSVDEARRQAALRGHQVERELLLYVLHGVLHCLGHDDHDDLAFARMHAEEDRILTAIGVGSTFSVKADGEAGA